MLQTSWLEVDLGRLDNNLRLFRRLVGDGVKICGVIKADAYSLGPSRWQTASKLVVSIVWLFIPLPRRQKSTTPD